MTEGEEGAEGSAENDDVIASIDRFSKGALVAMEDGEDILEGRRGAMGGAGIEIAIELKEFREKGEDKREGNLRS